MRNPDDANPGGPTNTPDPDPAWLIGPGDSAYPLGEMFQIGREPERYNNLEIRDRRVSSVHAVILRLHDGRYWITDWKSHNGTCVDGERIVGPHRVVSGTRIAIGSHQFVFQDSTSDVAEAPDGTSQHVGLVTEPMSDMVHLSLRAAGSMPPAPGSGAGGMSGFRGLLHRASVLGVLLGWFMGAFPANGTPPVILQEPVPQNVVAGATLSARVTVSGEAPLDVQWFRDGSALTGATNLVLEIPDAQRTNTAFYHAVITNVQGAVTSKVVSLTVDLPGNALALRPRGSFSLGLQDSRAWSAGVTIRGQHAFVVHGFSQQLRVVDVSDPDAPTRVASVWGFDYPFDVALAGDHALVAARTQGLGIVDVKDPLAPRLVRFFRMPTGMANSIEVVGHLAFVGNESGLVVLDVSDPPSPRVIANTVVAGNANGVRVEGSRAFVAGWTGGVSLVDVGNPAMPVLGGRFPTGTSYPGFAFDVVWRDAAVYVADASDGLVTVQWDGPTNSVQTSRLPGESWGVELAGPWVLMADGRAGLRVLGLNDPLRPAQIGQHIAWGGVDRVLVRGSRLFTVGRAFGITDLETPGLAPVITHSPEGSQPILGTRLRLEAGVLGGEPMSYQWFKDGVAVDGGTNRILEIGAVEFSDGGAYVVRASNASGTNSSAPAQVEVRKVPQVLTWASPATNAVLRWHQPVPLVATASSGLPVSFRVQEGPAYIVDGSIIATNTGSITLVAEQEGDTRFSPGTLTRTLNRPSYVGERLGEWPGIPRGLATGLFVQSDRAYVTLGDAGLAIFDINNASAPMRLGGIDTSGYASAVIVVGNIAYVADYGSGLQVIDVSNPAAPVYLGVFDTSGVAMDVRVVGNLAYVADDGAGLQVIDVSNPSAPVRLGGYDTSGGARAVQVIGQLAFVADGGDGLQVIDVSTPSAPVRLGGLDTSGFANGVHVAGDLALVADDAAGLQVIDVSAPSTPVQVGNYDTSGRAFGVQMRGTIALVADAFGGLQAIDLSNPAAPVRLGAVDTVGAAGAVHLVGHVAYVAAGAAGLQLIDVVNPSTPARVGGVVTSGSVNAVQVAGNRAYVADGDAGLQVIDVSNPSKPVALGNLDTSGSAQDLKVVGDLAYVADWGAGLQVIDVSNPAVPERMGGFDTTGAARAVQVVEGLAYVADDSAGLQVIDVRVPSAPLRVGGFDTSGAAYGVDVVGILAYVADWGAGLQVIDASDPAALVRRGGFDTAGRARCVRLVGHLAYVADGDAGLQVIDARNPAAPVRLGGFNTSGSAAAVELVGNLAYVADGGSGVVILDVTDSSAPVLAGGFDTGGIASGLQIVGEIAYVADGNSGLQIFRVRSGISQTMEFVAPTNVFFTRTPLALTASASSGLPVTFKVVSGPASVDGDRLTLTGEGTVVVRAEQAGNAQFQAASVERSITVVAPPPPPALTGVSLVGSDTFRFDLGGAAGSRVVVEFSPDLRSWVPLSTNTMPGSLEMPVEAGSGFYRAVVRP